MIHVDDFIDGTFETVPHSGMTNYARWILAHARMPAGLQMAVHKFIKDRKLFCTWNGKRYRCTGASRMGDVWLTSNMEKDHGYDERVSVDEVTEWSDTP